MILAKFQQPRKCNKEGCINAYPWWASLPLCRIHRRERDIRPTTLAEFAKGAHEDGKISAITAVLMNNPILDDMPFIGGKVKVRDGLPKVFWRKT